MKNLDWKMVVCYCVTVISVLIYFMPYTHKGMNKLHDFKHQIEDEIENGTRIIREREIDLLFRQAKQERHTILFNLQSYKKIKGFNDKFIEAMGGK